MLRPLLLLVLLTTVPRALPAQQPVAPEPGPAVADTAWDAPRTLELIGRAQQRRAEAYADTGLVNYRAEARLRVYFYLDREDLGQRNLVKTDQLALEVLWQAPSLTRQRIIGWRDRKSLPTNIHYHLDHLTVVQENFGDEIRLGDGDEVQGVIHPAAPAAERFYQYRLADSLTLRLPGATEPVRVYELEVRPRDASQPGLVGSVFVDQRAGDIVRMDFTFTPAAYRDPYLDYINISLDNGLWKGRFWLPNEQRVELRRRLPQLDIPAGSVIRATARVGDYQFNEPIPPQTFAGPRVTALPREQREAFEFEEDLHAELREEGLGPEIELGEVRRQARELVREQALERADGVRLRLPGASEVLRYNRAEGLVAGLGVTLQEAGRAPLHLYGGRAFGAGHWIGRATLELGSPGSRWLLSGYANAPRDVGVGPAASGVVASLGALFAGRDPTDLFFASGASLGHERPLGSGWLLDSQLRVEAQRSAEPLDAFSFTGEFRPVRDIDRAWPDGSRDGRLALQTELRLHRPAPVEAARWWSADLELGLGTGEYETGCTPGTLGPCGGEALSWIQPQARLRGGRLLDGAETRLEWDARAGVSLGEIPQQQLFLIGGRGTLPGYGFREFGGDRFAAATLTASRPLQRPWLRGRVLGALGWAGVGGAGEDALARWGVPTTSGLMPALGVGLGLWHDILHLDLARGLGEAGEWQLILEASPQFWDFL